MISSLFDKTAIISRLADVPETDKQAFSSHIAALPCAIQPQDAAFTPDVPGSFGKNWIMFCDTADIVEGDRVTIDSKEYRVVGVESFSFIGEAHMEIVLRIFE